MRSYKYKYQKRKSEREMVNLLHFRLKNAVIYDKPVVRWTSIFVISSFFFLVLFTSLHPNRFRLFTHRIFFTFFWCLFNRKYLVKRMENSYFIWKILFFCSKPSMNRILFDNVIQYIIVLCLTRNSFSCNWWMKT